MASILTSLFGDRFGIDRFGNIVSKGGIVTGGGGAPLAGGSARTLTADDFGKTILLDTLAGTTITLPAAIGSGGRYRFIVSVLATSVSHKIQVANASDTMIGGGVIADTDSSGAAYAFLAASTSDTITLNRSTTGSVTVGEWIEIEDYAPNVWKVDFLLSGTGTPVSPFSAAVS